MLESPEEPVKVRLAWLVSVLRLGLLETVLSGSLLYGDSLVLRTMLVFSLEPVEGDAVIPRTLWEASEAVIIISVVFTLPVASGVLR